MSKKPNHLGAVAAKLDGLCAELGISVAGEDPVERLYAQIDHLHARLRAGEAAIGREPIYMETHRKEVERLCGKIRTMDSHLAMHKERTEHYRSAWLAARSMIRKIRFAFGTPRSRVPLDSLPDLIRKMRQDNTLYTEELAAYRDLLRAEQLDDPYQELAEELQKKERKKQGGPGDCSPRPACCSPALCKPYKGTTVRLYLQFLNADAEARAQAERTWIQAKMQKLAEKIVKRLHREDPPHG